METRRTRAEAIRRRALAGEDFAALARALSDDASSREEGGDLGFFTRGTHTRAFDDAAFALPPRRISGVVRSEFGFHVIQALEHRSERERSFAEARPAIEARLLARKQAERLRSWLEQRRRQAKVVQSQ
jgi:parvulin-like peptidyl-prolyl isomerase